MSKKNKIKSMLAIIFYLLPTLSVAQDHIENPPPDVIIYMNDFPPYAYINENQMVEGPWVEKISDYLDQTNLSYQIDIVPWQRAYLEATTKDNVLIAHLDRTTEREAQFHWLVPVTSLTYSLIAHTNSEFIGQTLDEILASYGTVICSKGTAHCNILRSVGFPEGQILEFATYDAAHFHSLIAEKRVDFMLEDFEAMQQQLEKLGIYSTSIIDLFPISTITSYLAASKNINPAILEQLHEVENIGDMVE